MTSMEKKEMPPAQPYGAERGETGLAPEGETIDATEFFEDYRQHKLEEVGVEAEAALDIPDPEALARNAGYGEEESERLVLEAGIREELEKNRQAIESLEVEAKEGIMAVDTAPETFSRELPQAEAGAGAETSEPDAEKERTMEKFREERAGILERTLTSEVVSSGLDFVPIAGGVKMAVEGIAGKTLSGKKLEGRYRIIHTGAGIATIALDFTGIGEVGKGAIIVGKGIPASEKLALKLAERGAIKGEKIVTRGVELMKNNPELTRMAEEALEAKAKEQIRNVRQYAQNNAENNG